MASIIVAFPKIENARNIKAALVRNGYNVVATCQTGAFVMNVTDSMDSGIVICGYKLTDMMYSELRENLPSTFKMVVVTSPSNWNENGYDDIVFEPIPLNTSSLLNTLEMLIETSFRVRRKPKRSSSQNETILKAKAILMEKNGMTENDAHRYIQKQSMESGNNMVETAEMILLIYQ